MATNATPSATTVRRDVSAAASQPVVDLAVAAVLLVPPLFVETGPPLFLALIAAGLPVAPSASAGFLLVGRDAPAGTDAEAYTWLSAAAFVGLSLGTSVGGWTQWPFGAAVTFAAASTVVAWVLLRPPAHA